MFHSSKQVDFSVTDTGKKRDPNNTNSTGGFELSLSKFEFLIIIYIIDYNR